MRAWVGVSLGLMLVLAGALFGLLFVGVLLIADCTASCVASHQRWVAGGLAALGFAVAAGGIALLVASRRRLRRTRPPAP